MRKALSIFLLIAGGLATIASGLSSFLMEDERRHVAYNYLLASIGLVIVGIIVGVIHIWTEPNPDKAVKLQRIKRGEKRAFGVLWDSDLHPLCPVCRTPLILSTRNLIYRIDLFNNSIPPPKPIPHCLKCDKALPLYDDNGNDITLSEAKELLSPKEAKREIETPKPQPQQVQTPDNPQPPEPAVYQPDDKDKEIIRYLYKGTDCHLSFIAEFARLDTQETSLRLNKLISNKFIRPLRSRPRRAVDPYRLTDKGIQFAIDNDLQDQPKPKEPEAKINTPESGDAHHQTPSPYKPDKTAIEILKQISKGICYEDELANALKLNPVEVRISLAILEMNDYIEFHHAGNRPPSYQLADKGIDFLHKPVRTVPFPSGHDLIDETKTRILQYLATPNCRADEQAMSVVLNLHPTRLQVHLSELAQHDYVAVDGVNEWFETIYRLTTKAKKFLIERNLID
jgi:predicted ArsR family transcriptional regulator